MNKSIKYLGFAFFGALLLLVLGAAGPIFIPVNNGTGNTTTLNNPKTAGINDLNGTTRIIQIAGGSSGFNDGFGVNRVQIDAGGVIKLKATNAAQLFQLTADGYGEASFPWTFDNGILVGGNTNNSVWLFNPKNGLYRNFLFTDSNGDTQIDPDNDLHINSANNFINGSLDLLGPFHITNSSIFYAEIGLGISAPTHKFHIVSTSNDVVGIDSTGVDSASMLHIQNTGVQGPFFDIHSVSQRWGIGVGTNGNYELRRSPVGTDPVNGTTVLTIDSNSVATFGGNIIGNGAGLTNLNVTSGPTTNAPPYTLVASGTNITIDMLALGPTNTVTYTLVANTGYFITNVVPGKTITVALTQDSTGTRTLAPNSAAVPNYRFGTDLPIQALNLSTNGTYTDIIKLAGLNTNALFVGFIKGFQP